MYLLSKAYMPTSDGSFEVMLSTNSQAAAKANGI